MYEYAMLFDVPPGMTPLEKVADAADYWKKQRTEIGVGCMGYRTRTTKAGEILMAEIYPIWGREKIRKVRAARKNVTPERMQRYNEEKARVRLELLLDNNFTREDLELTLTYRYDPGWKEAKKDVKRFLDKVRAIRKRRGLPPMKYVAALEDEKDGRGKQIHCHIVMNAGIDREELETIWRAGTQEKGIVNGRQLQPDKEGLRALARYIYDQNRGKDRAKGQRHYSCSKNLTEPKVHESDSRCSNARVKRLATDFDNDAKAIMEKLYPGYEFVCGRAIQGEGNAVWFSDIVDGAYIRVMMHRKPEKPKRGGMPG